MWNNRAMSNRYWISVGAIAVAAALAGVYVARLREPARRAFARVGHVAAAAARARAVQSARHAGRAARRRTSLRGHPTLVFFGFTHCPDVCPTTLALLASVQKQAAMSRVSRWRSSAWIRSATRREQLGTVHLVIRRRSYRPHRQRARDCESHEELRRGGQPRRSAAAATTPWITRRPCSRSTPSARIVAVFTPPFNAAALTRDVARLAPSSRGRLMSEARSRRRRARVRRAPAPAAAARHLAPGARRDPLAQRRLSRTH